MIGKKSGFIAIVKEKAPHVLTTHCVLRRQTLASKTLSKKLKEVMKITVQAVNFIRGRALNHRLFKNSVMRLEQNTVCYCTTQRYRG